MPRFSISLVHAQELAPYARLLEANGISAGTLFERSGIPAETVSDPAAMITMHQAYTFADRGARYAGDEILGSIAGQSVLVSDLGPLGRALQRAPSLYEASTIFREAMHATEPGSQCWIEKREDGAWLCYCPETRFEVGAAQAEQFDLQCLLKVVRLAAGPDWIPRRIMVSACPAGTLRRVPEFAEAKVKRHRRTTAIGFSKDLFVKSLENVPEVAAENGERHTAPTSISETEHDLAGAVRRLLNSLAKHEPVPVLDAMAERFGVCGRTLQRALEAEGASYRRLTQHVRFTRAAALLRDTTIPLKSVAAELGYSSLNSFVRGFREVAGVTPNSYRKRNLLP